MTDSKTCSKTLCRDFNLAIEGALGWQGNMAVVLFFSRFYISCSYSCTISFLVKILLVKLKNLYIQYAWISIIKNKIVTKKDDGICQNFLLSLFHLSSKFVMWKDLNLKFRSKFNHGYLHSAIWKALYNFKVKKAGEA